MKLEAYVLDGHKLDIRPAPLERDWMEATGDRFAYRCLPLNIANAHGWEMLCPSAFAASWNGGPGLTAIKMVSKSSAPLPVTSHFGSGILTFHIPCLFRTEVDYDLMIQGPINRPKDGIAPLSGVVETDWAPYTFTMNWKFTRPGAVVHFEQGEPFCHIFPIRRGELEAVTPEMRSVSHHEDVKNQLDLWSKSREKFNADLKRPGSEAQAEKWQKLYYQGVDATGSTRTSAEHRTRLRLRPFQRESTKS